VNRVGASFTFRLHEETGAALPDIVRAYLAAREVFGLVPLWQTIESLDNKVADATQTAMIIECLHLVQRGTLWFLRHRNHLRDLAETLSHFSASVEQLAGSLYAVVAGEYRGELDNVTARYLEQGVPETLVQRVACLEELYSGLDIVEVAGALGRPVELVARVYFALGGLLDLHWMGHQIARLPTDTHWQALACTALQDDLSSQARNLCADALRENPEEEDVAKLVAAWQAKRGFQLERCRQLFTEIRAASAADMPMLSVALRELRGLGGTAQA
jgi:glutamate dehydrogenase